MFLRNQFKKVGMFNLPLVKKQEIDLENASLIGYDKINQSSDYEKIVHFFLDDYRFESIYTNPEKKIETLKNFKAVLTPDFSMYVEMPTALQLFNTFKNRWVSAYLQERGISVIPTVCWGDLASFNFCFDAIEKGSIVAVSTLGVRNEKSHFMLGYNEMLRRIKPCKIICYGKPFEEMKGDIIEIDYAETNNLSKNYPDVYIKTFYGYIENEHYLSQKGGGSASGQSSGNPDSKSLPTKSKPNSKKTLYKNGKKVQEREYDENGNPKIDIDYTDHGNPKWHPKVPHKHLWINGKRGKKDE